MRAYCRSNPALPTPQSSLSCQPHYEEATRLDVEGLVITMRISTMCLHSSPPRTCTRPTRTPSPRLLFNKHYLPLRSNSPQRHPRPPSRLPVLHPRSLYLLQHPSPLMSTQVQRHTLRTRKAGQQKLELHFTVASPRQLSPWKRTAQDSPLPPDM